MLRLKNTVALVTAVAAVSSLTPCLNAKAATKLETIDGTINNAKAYAAGRYVFDGYRNDDMNNGIYFFDGAKDNLIEDVDNTGSELGDRYGMNYLNFSKDDILFNLLTGQAEDDTADSRQTIAEDKFKNKVLSRANRYEGLSDFQCQGKITDDNFSSVWYEYRATTNSYNYYVPKTDEHGNTVPVKDYYTIYLNEDGKYIDASDTLNLTYYDKDAKKYEFDTYEDIAKYNQKHGQRFKIGFEKALILDTENIYRVIALVDLQSAHPEKPTVYAQKISMEQGDKKDGAYTPKKVTTYEFLGLGLMDLMGLIPNPGVPSNSHATARVAGNALYIVTPDKADDKITMKKYNLKNVKKKVKVRDEDGNEVTKTESKRAIELDDDFNGIDDKSMTDFCVDTYGNLWVLYKGKVQKVVNGKLETMYTVDNSMDRLSVFDDNNMIIWNSDKQGYSVVTPAMTAQENVTNETQAENTEAKAEVKAGWIKNSDNTWSYYKEDGTKASGWVLDNSRWYYLNSNGIMQTGWLKEGDNWYYLNASGDMMTGWTKDSSNMWYYMDNSGKMLSNTTIDGYVLGQDGAWIQ